MPHEEYDKLAGGEQEGEALLPDRGPSGADTLHGGEERGADELTGGEQHDADLLDGGEQEPETLPSREPSSEENGCDTRFAAGQRDP
jgi:hypothetical protein